jgi:hypothetical protein
LCTAQAKVHSAAAAAARPHRSWPVISRYVMISGWAFRTRIMIAGTYGRKSTGTARDHEEPA